MNNFTHQSEDSVQIADRPLTVVIAYGAPDTIE
jgi:hypothetical protein